MEFETRQYFKEHSDPRVTGFTIIETGSGQVRIAEKWNHPDGDDRWLTYWVDDGDLTERMESGDCEHVGNLTDEQFTAVCENTDERALLEA